MQKGFAHYILVLIVVAVVAVVAVGVLVWRDKLPIPGNNGLVACTQEAKICPDGSSVGRSGPNCDFAACPNVSTTYKNDEFGFQFDYAPTSHISQDNRTSFEDYEIILADKTLRKFTNVSSDTDYMVLEISDGQSCDSAFDKKTPAVKKTFGTNEYFYDEGAGSNGVYFFRMACLIHDNKVFVFGNNTNFEEDLTKTQDLFEKVLSTFKFSSADIANWKTYSNAKYGFSIQYPPDWALVPFSSPDTIPGLKPQNDPAFSQPYYHDFVIREACTDPSIADTPLEQWIKLNGVNEVQGLKQIKTEEKITTNSGVEGYRVVWNTTPIGGRVYKLVYVKLPKPVPTSFGGGDYSCLEFEYGNAKYSTVEDRIIQTFKFN